MWDKLAIGHSFCGDEIVKTEDANFIASYQVSSSLHRNAFLY